MSSPTLSHIQSAIKAFTRSSSQFHSVHSHPTAISQQTAPISALLVLDSSFNPPTKAHAYLVHQAVSRLHSIYQEPSTHLLPSNYSSSSGQNGSRTQARILLLHSTKNADKPSTPASTEQRLQMMILFAQEIWSNLTSGPNDKSSKSVPEFQPETATCKSTETSSNNQDQSNQSYHSNPISGIDIALTSEPRFLEKSVFLARSGDQANPYAALQTPKQGPIPQWHLLGYDTMIRLLDGKYYPPSGSLSVLAPLFEVEGNRILVVARGGRSESVEQKGFVERLTVPSSQSGFAAEGWKAEWGEKIEVIDAFEDLEHEDGHVFNVSSTAVRDAAKKGDHAHVKTMCDDLVAEYVLDEKLYLEN